MRVQAWNQQLPLARLSCFRLNDDKATPGGAVKVNAHGAFSANLDRPVRGCRLFRKLEAVPVSRL